MEHDRWPADQVVRGSERLDRLAEMASQRRCGLGRFRGLHNVDVASPNRKLYAGWWALPPHISPHSKISPSSILCLIICRYLQVFSGHQGPITSGEFTPDGKCVVSTGGDEDCSLRVWNPKTSECTAHVHGHGFHGDSGALEVRLLCLLNACL